MVQRGRIVTQTRLILDGIELPFLCIKPLGVGALVLPPGAWDLATPVDEDYERGCP
jgi:hypothetical protein